jgi:hypothetical protein
MLLTITNPRSCIANEGSLHLRPDSYQRCAPLNSLSLPWRPNALSLQPLKRSSLS